MSEKGWSQLWLDYASKAGKDSVNGIRMGNVNVDIKDLTFFSIIGDKDSKNI